MSIHKVKGQQQTENKGKQTIQDMAKTKASERGEKSARKIDKPDKAEKVRSLEKRRNKYTEQGGKKRESDLKA